MHNLTIYHVYYLIWWSTPLISYSISLLLCDAYNIGCLNKRSWMHDCVFVSDSVQVQLHANRTDIDLNRGR
jgi:hypothetical protein